MKLVISRRLLSLGLGFCLAIPSICYAEDTDLFMENPGIVAGLPNVLFILDNTANWSSSAGSETKFDLEKRALQTVFGQLPENRFNVGLMLFSESGGGNSNPSGGYVRYAIREMNSQNRTSLLALISSLSEKDDKGNSAEYALAMHEAFLYFKGQRALAGHNKVKADPAAFNPNPQYQSPIVDVCAKNYIIFISNGAPDNGENNEASATLESVGGKLNTDPIKLEPSTRQANWSDEYARFLAANDINTYVLDVNPLTTGQGPANTALLRSMANQGRGRYYAVDTASDLVIALDNAFNEMKAVDSVYASTALPVSVNVRGTYLNEVYMAVFRPDKNARPRWLGNLKLYQLAVDPTNDTLFLADINGKRAQSSVTGFIRSDATSYWTNDSDYWAFSPRGNPESDSDAPDGEVVEKGGSAQVQRAGWPGRKLYTCARAGGCDASIGLSSEEFDAMNIWISVASLGVDSATDRASLIDWIRGEDNTSPAERASGQVRPSFHGDVVHSRPTVVNFNRAEDDSDIVVFYGANDGILRAVRGGKEVENGGAELWGFVAPEFFKRFARIRDDFPTINVPSDPTAPAGNKPYFMDGNMSVFAEDIDGDGGLDVADGDRVFLYATMRRGGRFLYAFDVSEPEAPKYLWKRSFEDPGFGELGQTWSEAKVAKVRIGAQVTPVVIFGAGYDPAADDIFPSGTYTIGRGVMIVNAVTGSLIWQAGPSPSGAEHNLTVSGMTHSMPSEMTVIDRDRDGYADRIYAVDSGANVWRVDIASENPSEWSASKLAVLGGSSSSEARKFLYPPDVVYSSDGNGPFDAVLLGSGDREKPFNTATSNQFYMLKDRRTGLGGSAPPTITVSELYDATDNLVQSADAAIRLAAVAELQGYRGWYIQLAPGEKVVGSAVTLAGNVYFSTQEPTAPDPNTCVGSLGTARIYVMGYKDATPTPAYGRPGQVPSAFDRSMVVPGGGFLPSPTPIIVKIGDRLYQTVSFGPNIVSIDDATLDRRKRAYWYRCIEGEGDSASVSCE